ncbi:hypothetical protein [Costertonia aggregata]|uniref:Lipoprotein n=1 Tax=Costertonia aggregata TaxID=343403 RepID=A0A7H9AP45_9FLAO|nr:hypothetical protein [Costertonia aggregata]QLG45197.1 hypothetical protein HYG79_07490 [Costertonia aggregata]
MKKSIYILSIISMGLFSCASQKKLQTKTPFELGTASCHEWVGGKEETGKGLLLKIPVNYKPLNSLPENHVSLKQAFFRGKVSDIVIDQEGGATYATAKFIKYFKAKPDLIMHADSRQEVGNQPPKMIKNKEIENEFPFKLAKDEAVISYMQKGKLKYTKITGIKDKTPVIHNSKPKN